MRVNTLATMDQAGSDHHLDNQTLCLSLRSQGDICLVSTSNPSESFSISSCCSNGAHAAEPTRRLEEGLCFHCGGSGHVIQRLTRIILPPVVETSLTQTVPRE
ncbi:unnamed protein product, partial [Pleuronectes platessa]